MALLTRRNTPAYGFYRKNGFEGVESAERAAEYGTAALFSARHDREQAGPPAGEAGLCPYSAAGKSARKRAN